MKLIGLVVIVVMLIGCQPERTNLQMDHVNVWVKNPIKAKAALEQIGFTPIPDSLSQVHRGQGTTGRYFYFLNGYLELIYVHNEAEFVENATANNALDFIERSNSPDNGYLPFSIALAMKNYDKTKIPFQTVEYRQDWMEKDNSIYMAKNSKLHKEEPSIFVMFPAAQYDKFEHMDSLINIPEEYAIWRTYYKHKNGAEKISKIEIHTNNINEESNTIKCLNALGNVTITEGKEYLMELYFDNQGQQKTFDLRPEIPLKIHL